LGKICVFFISSPVKDSLCLQDIYGFISDESLFVKTTCLQALVKVMAHIKKGIFRTCKTLNIRRIQLEFEKKKDETLGSVINKIRILIDHGINAKDDVYIVTICKSIDEIIKLYGCRFGLP
jgi:hypothetical protein